MRTASEIIDALIGREGGYSNDPDDAGGETMLGITEATARAYGYTGAMIDLPRPLAVNIYFDRYYQQPGFARLADHSEAIAVECLDAGVNLGPAWPSQWLQRALNVLNREGKDYADLLVDGRCGPITARTLGQYLSARGKEGERVMLAALNALQGSRYIEIAEHRPSQERFVYGWLRARVLEPLS